MKNKFFKLVLTMFVAVLCVFGIAGCGTSASLTKQDYAKVFDSIISTVNNLGTQPQALRAEVAEGDFVTVDNPTQAKNMLRGNIAMVYFLKNLCNTNSFVVKDELQECIVIDNVSASFTQTFKIRLNMSYNKDTQTVKSTVYCEDHTDENVYAYFLEFEIMYNFNSDTLSGFNILGYMGSKQNLEKESVNYYKFAGNTLKMLNHSATVFDSFAGNILQEVETIGSPAFADNLTDYSTQYIQGMMEASGVVS